MMKDDFHSVSIVLLLTLFLLANLCQATTELSVPDKVFTRHGSPVHCVEWSPVHDVVVSGDEINIARIWNPDSAEQICEFTKHTDVVEDVAWSPDGSEIASSSRNGIIHIWSGTYCTERLFFGAGGAVRCVEWSPNGDRIAGGREDGSVKIWNSDSGSEIRNFNEQQGPVSEVSWASDSSRIASASMDGTVKVWNPDTGAIDYTFSGHGAGVLGVDWSPDGTRLVSVSEDLTARVWYSGNSTEIMILRGHSGAVCAVDWSPDGNYIATSSLDNRVFIWEAITGMKALTLSKHSAAVSDISWSPNSRRLVSVSLDGTAAVWDLSGHINSPPGVPVFEETGSGKLKRNQTLHLRALATDDTTPAMGLTPDFQHKASADPSWSYQYLSTPVFSSGRWCTDLSPSKDASLGHYDLRVRFEDDKGAFSQWTVLDKAIEVVNNPPTVVDVDPPPRIVNRGNIETIGILAEDVEDPVEDLVIECSLSRSGENYWSSDYFLPPEYNAIGGSWKAKLKFPPPAPCGDYDIRIRCSDWDRDASEWYYLNKSIWLENSAPTLEGFSLNRSEVFRGGPIEITISARDAGNGTESSPPLLEFRSLTDNWMDMGCDFSIDGGTFKAEYSIPLDFETGKYSFRIKLYDDENTASEWYYFDDLLSVKNNPPRIDEDFNNLWVYDDRNNPVNLSAYSSDAEDEALQLKWTILKSSGEMLFEARIENGSILEIFPITPFIIGKGSIQLRVTDTDGDIQFRTVEVSLLDASDRRITIDLSSPRDRAVVTDNIEDFSWRSDGDADSVRYSIFLGSTRYNMVEVYKGLFVTNKKVAGLDNDIVYYWKVSARIYGEEEIFESEIWSFSVDPDYTPRLTVGFNATDVMLEKGSSLSINLTISNPDNVPITVYLEVAGELKDHVELVNPSEPITGEVITVPVTIISSPSLGTGTYVLTINVSYSGHTQKATLEVTILGSENSSGPSSVWIIVLIVVIVIAVLGAVSAPLFFIYKKRREPPPVTDYVPASYDLSVKGRYSDRAGQFASFPFTHPDGTGPGSVTGRYPPPPDHHDTMKPIENTDILIGSRGGSPSFTAADHDSGIIDGATPIVGSTPQGYRSVPSTYTYPGSTIPYEAGSEMSTGVGSPGEQYDPGMIFPHPSPAAQPGHQAFAGALPVAMQDPPPPPEEPPEIIDFGLTDPSPAPSFYSADDTRSNTEREAREPQSADEGEDIMKQLLKKVVSKEITVEEYKMLVADLKST